MRFREFMRPLLRCGFFVIILVAALCATPAAAAKEVQSPTASLTSVPASLPSNALAVYSRLPRDLQSSEPKPINGLLTIIGCIYRLRKTKTAISE